MPRTALFWLILATTSLPASVTINVSAGYLQDESGGLITAEDRVVLVVDRSGDGLEVGTGDSIEPGALLGDGDDIVNLIEFIGDTDPRSGDFVVPGLLRADSATSVSYVRSRNRFNVATDYEVSTNLHDWDPASPGVETTPLTADRERATLHFPEEVPRRFVRIRWRFESRH